MRTCAAAAILRTLVGFRGVSSFPRLTNALTFGCLMSRSQLVRSTMYFNRIIFATEQFVTDYFLISVKHIIDISRELRAI